jgi:prepilin-type N-terminal cleavage/methylation domain-containing protein
MDPSRPKAAFTLVELLTVIAIIALLMALLIPAVQSVRESARAVQCGSNIRQISLALQAYASALGTLPSGVANQNRNKNPPGVYLGYTPDTWATEIMPRMELANLFDGFDFRPRSSWSSTNQDLMLRPIPTLICPSDPQASQPILKNRCSLKFNSIGGLGHGQWYAGSIGPMATRPFECPFCSTQKQSLANSCCLGVEKALLGTRHADYPRGTPVAGFFGQYPTAVALDNDSCPDGMSNTILVGETLPNDTMHNGLYATGFMTAVTNIPLNTFALPDEIPADGGTCPGAVSADGRMNGIKSKHPGGAFVALADGAVRRLSETISLEVLYELGSRKSPSGSPILGSIP